MKRMEIVRSDKESAPLVELENVHKNYQLGRVTVPALAGVDLKVESGEFLVIHGPSGSGKTTLLNIVGCLDQVTSGRFLLEGEDLTKVPTTRLAGIRNQKIGFIFQGFNLIPVLNVVENIEFPCLVRSGKESKAELRQRASELAELVGLGGHLDHKPDELSGGQRQRVAIARALITEPRLVLADEPTANLDSATSLTILEIMESLNRKKNVTFVFSTHDPVVMERAQRKIVMRDGKVGEDRTSQPASKIIP